MGPAKRMLFIPRTLDRNAFSSVFEFVGYRGRPLAIVRNAKAEREWIMQRKNIQCAYSYDTNGSKLCACRKTAFIVQSCNKT